MSSINDIVVTALEKIDVLNGDVWKGISNSDVGYKTFGEAYFSFIEPNKIKAWKCHKNMTLNLIAPVGSIFFVFIDANNNIREEKIGASRYVRLTVPPNIWFGFKGISTADSILLNIADIKHDPLEVDRKDLSAYEYKWD